MILIALANSGDDSAHEYMRRWVEQAGGSLPLDELEEKFEDRFGFRPGFLTREVDIKNFGLTDVALKLDGDIVSLASPN
jgi:hypothetical protein